MKKILFVTYGAGHVDIVVQLAKELRKRGNVEYSILALTTASSALKNLGIEHKTCKDYLNLIGYQSALIVGEKLAKVLWSPLLGVSYEDTVSYLGVSMTDLISNMGYSDAFSAYEQEGRSVFCPVEFMEKIIDIEKADAVVTTCYVRMEKAAVLAAKNKGIESILVDDLLGSSVLGNDIFSKELIAPLWMIPNKLCVLNQSVKNLVVDAGMPKNNVFVTGQPVFSDWVKRYDKISVSPILEKSTSEYEKVITYITTGCKDIFKEHVAKIIFEARVKTNWKWIIKLHPSISVEEYDVQFPCVPANIDVYGNYDILKLCKVSDVLALHSSTVGLAGLFFDIPLIIMNDDKVDLQGMPYVKSGAGTQVLRHDSLIHAIEKRLNEKGIEKCSVPLFFNTPNAALNIISILEE